MYPNYDQHTLDMMRITEEIRKTHLLMDKFIAQNKQTKPVSRIRKVIR